MMREAITKLEQKNYKEAIRLFSNMIENEPNNPLAFQGLAKAYYKSNLLEKAKESSERAIELDPKLALPYSLLAYIEYKQTGNIDRCYDLAKQAFLLNPDNPDILECFGFSCLLKGENEEGIQYLEKALPDSSSKYEIQNNLSVAYARLNRFDEAYKATKSLYRYKPSIRTFFKVVLLFFSLNKVKTITRIILLLSFSLSFWFPGVLIIPFIYAMGLIVLGIYSISQKVIKGGIVTIIVSIMILSLIFLIIGNS